VCSHTGRKTACASFTSRSVMFQAISLSPSPFSVSCVICSSNCPDLIMSDTMMGLLVAPVAPIARFFFTIGGSIESSQTFVPVAINDFSDIRVHPFREAACGGAEHTPAQTPRHPKSYAPRHSDSQTTLQDEEAAW